MEITDTLSIATKTIQSIQNNSFQSTISTGMEGVIPKSILANNPTIFIILMLLFIILVATVIVSRHIENLNLKSIFTIKISSYEPTKINRIRTVQSNYLKLLFSVGVVCMYIYLTLKSSELNTDFSILKYTYTIVISIAFIVIKQILTHLITFTFSSKQIRYLYNSTYVNLLYLISILFYPILVIAIYSYPIIFQYTVPVGIIISIIFMILIFITLLKLFLSRPFALFYILLYLCTFEIIPFFILFQAYKAIL